MHYKFLLKFSDAFFGLIAGINFLQFLPLIAQQPMSVLSEVDNSIKVGMSLFGFIYFGLRIYYYHQNQKTDIKLKNEQIRQLEIDNNAKIMPQYLFKNDIESLKESGEYEISEERLKK